MRLQRQIAKIVTSDPRLAIFQPSASLNRGNVEHIPAITLEGDANGAPHPDPSSYAGRFSGRYAHRLINGGIGHNLPQEAPEAFAQAVIDMVQG
jgi:hypothetical protein